ncbi:hypothetical protein Tco_0770131 [Tanacetum coccineum]|uniref:Uncharacterized protein n=1 Tax=Tanacetum coccineum TaxID=301880 RepID=A0ABQ4ZBL5_9ASTR
MEQMTSICDMVGQCMQKKEEEKRIAEEQAAKARYWKIPICYDDNDDEERNGIGRSIKSSIEDLIPIPSESEGIPDKMCDVPFRDNSLPLDISKDQFEDLSESNDDSTSIDDDSFSIDDIEYVEASPPDSDLVSLEVVEIVIPEVGGIDNDILLIIKDDILRKKLLNVNLLIANIEALKDNPTPPSDFMTKSSSTSPNFFLEETNTFDNSLPESETFCFDLEEISSGSTTTRSDYSLPDYEAFCNDHIEEKSSGSTTTHFDFSLSKYDSFIFDLSINPFPPTDKSDFYHEEFIDELAQIISPPENDFHVPNIVPTHPTLHLDLNFILSSDSLFAYVVWIFLPFLTYLVAPPYLLPSENEYTIFDPDISIYHSFMPGVSHQSGTFMKFNDCPDFEASRARGFVLRSLELQILSFILGIQYPNLID